MINMRVVNDLRVLLESLDQVDASWKKYQRFNRSAFSTAQQAAKRLRAEILEDTKVNGVQGKGV